MWAAKWLKYNQMKGKFLLDKYLVNMSLSCLAQGNYTLCIVQFDLLPCPLGICSFFFHGGLFPALEHAEGVNSPSLNSWST